MPVDEPEECGLALRDTSTRSGGFRWVAFAETDEKRRFNSSSRSGRMNLSSKSTHALTRCLSCLQTSGCESAQLLSSCRSTVRSVRNSRPLVASKVYFHFPSRTPKRVLADTGKVVGTPWSRGIEQAVTLPFPGGLNAQ